MIEIGTSTTALMILIVLLQAYLAVGCRFNCLVDKGVEAYPSNASCLMVHSNVLHSTSAAVDECVFHTVDGRIYMNIRDCI